MIFSPGCCLSGGFLESEDKARGLSIGTRRAGHDTDIAAAVEIVARAKNGAHAVIRLLACKVPPYRPKRFFDHVRNRLCRLLNASSKPNLCYIYDAAFSSQLAKIDYPLGRSFQMAA
jgi:hypothetical protein